MRNYPCNGAPKATSLLTTTGPDNFYLENPHTQKRRFQTRQIQGLFRHEKILFQFFLFGEFFHHQA